MPYTKLSLSFNICQVSMTHSSFLNQPPQQRLREWEHNPTSSGVARAFPGGQVDYPKDQIQAGNKGKMRNDKGEWRKIEEMLLFCPPSWQSGSTLPTINLSLLSINFLSKVTLPYNKTNFIWHTFIFLAHHFWIRNIPAKIAFKMKEK